MKILFCIPNLEHGGAERQTSYIAAELSRMGHEVHVASRGGGPNLQRILASGATWHRLGKAGASHQAKHSSLVNHTRAALAALLRLGALTRKIRPDVIQTVLAPMDVLGGTAALLTGTPWILKECSAAVVYTTYRRYWLRFAFGSLANAVISNSAHGRDYWQKAHTEDRLYVIPNAIPIAQIRAAEFRDTGFGLKSDDTVILYAGRIDIGKNVEALISALGLIAKDISFKAIICGDGANRASVEQIARDLGVADRIIFTGYIDNLWELMKRADVFVSFSRCEGCPNAILEAMASECPLVVSDIPGHREILDERDALFVKLDDPAEAATAILLTLTDVAAARRRTDSAKDNVSSRLSLKDAAQLYENSYSQVLQAHSKSGRSRGRTVQPATGEPATNQGEM